MNAPAGARAAGIGGVGPLAGGLPIPESVADEAARWLTLLMSDDVGSDDREQFERWRRSHPDHDRAWLHIEAVRGRLKVMQPAAAYQALSPFVQHREPAIAGLALTRRDALRTLFWTGSLGTTALLAARTQAWQHIAADHRTAVGEQRRIELTDGSVVMLNTASAIDVRFDGGQRLVRLVAGEILVVTGHAIGGPQDERPFIVETAQGRIRALGTRFTVRRQDEQTLVVVLQSAVEIAPLGAVEQTCVLQAGEQAAFSRQGVGSVAPAAAQPDAWTRGQIVADELPLADFLLELGRYRPGVVRCDPEVARLRLSGVFPVADTDRILTTLPSVLPVRVVSRTRYWVTLLGR